MCAFNSVICTFCLSVQKSLHKCTFKSVVVHTLCDHTVTFLCKCALNVANVKVTYLRMVSSIVIAPTLDCVSQDTPISYE